MSDVSLVAAFAAGVLALLSPCSALLLPSFFAYAFASRAVLMMRTGAFYLGLLITLVPLGTGASAASTLFYGHRPLLIAIAGWSIIALGVVQVLGRSFAMPFAARLHARSPAPGGAWTSTVALGAIYGLAGFCSGPVLGAILTMAATERSAIGGGLLLAVYALGMAAPLFALAALWERLDLGRRSWTRGRDVRLGPIRTHTTALASGLLFVAIGIVFLRFDGTAGITGTLGLADSAEVEFDAQRAVADVVAGIPAWAPPAAITLVAASLAWRRRDQGAEHARRRPADDTELSIAAEAPRRPPAA